MTQIPAGSRAATLARTLLIPLVAGALYGGWAAFIHGSLGSGPALRAALTQASLSITQTLVLVLLLQRLFRVPSNPLRGFWLAAGGASTLTITWLIAGHAFAGTPHIALTIAPSAIIGTGFCFVYARALLWRAGRSRS